MVRVTKLALVLAVVAQTTAAQSPVCSKSDRSLTAEQNDDDTCSLWYYDTWVLAGRNYQRGDAVGKSDIVVPFKLHSARPFPMYNRYQYFLHDPTTSLEDYIFAPSYKWPYSCHETFYNINADYNVTKLKNTKLTEPHKLNRRVAEGDAIFLECMYNDLSDAAFLSEFPNYAEIDFDNDAMCLDGLEVKESEIDGYGAFATYAYSEGDVIINGPLIHMHRAELMDKETQTSEVLLNYCFGIEESDLLLLPQIPTVNAINHNADAPNVAVLWDHSAAFINDFFEAKTEDLFGRVEGSSLSFKYIALRDIAPGEELVMDYGSAWALAYKKHLEAGKDKASFRHEMRLPVKFFPKDWVDNEKRNSDFAAFDTAKLAPGQVKQVQLTNGEKLGDYQNRVGFPDGLADYLEQWAEDMGITQLMEEHIIGNKSLPIDGERRVVINGGVWWIKRFDGMWSSDMHYITPDDDVANEQFFQALYAAGFDTAIAGLGKHHNLNHLSAYYASFIAVSHCVHSYIHSDSDDPRVFNMIFPIKQVENSNPELVLAPDVPNKNHVPYKYERDHGIALGLDGMHGTAPCDYRNTGKMRMVASVYMGEFDDDNIDEYVDAWNDPPYPRKLNGDLRYALLTRKHWDRNDASASIGNPMVPSLSAMRFMADE